MSLVEDPPEEWAEMAPFLFSAISSLRTSADKVISDHAIMADAKLGFLKNPKKKKLKRRGR